MVGGEEEFEVFVRVHEPRLRRALVAAYGPADGSDASASALAFAWERWDRVKVLDNPAGYLYRVGQTSLRRKREGRLEGCPVALLSCRRSEIFSVGN